MIPNNSLRLAAALGIALAFDGFAGAAAAQNGNPEGGWQGGHAQWQPGVNSAIANQPPAYAPPNADSVQRFSGYPYGYAYAYPPGYGYGSTHYGYGY